MMNDDDHDDDGDGDQLAEKEDNRLMKLREEYQATCTQSAVFDLTREEGRKMMGSQIDLAFSVQFNLAVQVCSSRSVICKFMIVDLRFVQSDITTNRQTSRDEYTAFLDVIKC